MEAAQDDVKVKIGKMIFYIHLAVSIWFFTGSEGFSVLADPDPGLRKMFIKLKGFEMGQTIVYFVVSI